MNRTVYLWIIRSLNLKISREEAVELGLTWRKNIFGDNVNLFNARSIWKDEEGRWYFCTELEE